MQGRILTAKLTEARRLDPTRSPRITTIYGDVPISGPKVWDTGFTGLVEFVTDGPHGFASGQWARLIFKAPFNLPFAGGVSHPMARVPGLLRIWVTSPVTFLVKLYDRKFPRSPAVDLESSVDLTGGTVSVSLPAPMTALQSRGALLPYEFAASLVSRFSGCIGWFPLPVMASDGAVDAIAQHVLAALGPTNKAVFEVGNECWNFGETPAGYCQQMSLLLGLGTGPQPYYVRRTAEVAARIKAVFAAAGRPNDGLSVLAWQFGGIGAVTRLAAAAGFKADVLSIAPYMDMPAAVFPAAASWGPARLQELARHAIWYGDLPTHGQLDRNRWAEWNRSVAAYEKAIGRRCLRIGYEGCFESYLPRDTPRIMARTWDCAAHPDAYDTEMVFYAVLQANGMDAITVYSHLYPMTQRGNDWGLYHWQGQQPGRGDGSDGKTINAFIGDGNTFPAGNVSVRGAAWRAWQRDSLLNR
jgi:hypothetical protein